MKKRIEINGKKTTIEARVLKSGEVAYYRGGKRVKTEYQKRLVKGVLMGLSPAEATGKGYREFARKWRDKMLSRDEIDNDARPGAEGYELKNWAAPVLHNDKLHHQYYASVRIKVDTLGRRSDSDILEGDSEGCAIVTVGLVRTANNRITRDFTLPEIKRSFGSLMMNTLAYYGHALCTNNPADDIQGVWRHGTK